MKEGKTFSINYVSKRCRSGFSSRHERDRRHTKAVNTQSQNVKPLLTKDVV